MTRLGPPHRAGQCTVPGCMKPSTTTRVAGMCSMHRARVARHGSPDVVRAPALRVRSDHHAWTGDQCSYHTAHARVSEWRGRASTQVCADCGGKAAHWSYNNCSAKELRANDGRRYSPDPADYEPRCVRCHSVFDAASRPVVPAAPGQRVCDHEGCIAAGLYGHFGNAFCSPHVRLYRTPALPGAALAPLVDCLIAQGLSLREIARRTGANRQRLSAIRSGAAFTFYRRVVDALVGLHDESCHDHALDREAS